SAFTQYVRSCAPPRSTTPRVSSLREPPPLGGPMSVCVAMGVGCPGWRAVPAASLACHHRRMKVADLHVQQAAAFRARRVSPFRRIPDPRTGRIGARLVLQGAFEHEDLFATLVGMRRTLRARGPSLERHSLAAE